jgi:hypothetical protein
MKYANKHFSTSGEMKYAKNISPHLANVGQFFQLRSWQKLSFFLEMWQFLEKFSKKSSLPHVVVAWDFFFNNMANLAKNYGHKKITQMGVR